jgi:hypothetical protein
MVKLTGADLVYYFNDKKVLTSWTFHYLLMCIRHDDIVHKPEATGYMILVSPKFTVSVYLKMFQIYCFLATVQTLITMPILMHPYMTDALDDGN